MASITCVNCRNTHYSVEAVRACHFLDTGRCGWLYEVPAGWDPDREDWIDAHVAECEGLAWATDRGFQCEHGHEHVNNETRCREGWEYADDEFEAGRLLAVGIQSVGMDGGSITPDMGAFYRTSAGL